MFAAAASNIHQMGESDLQRIDACPPHDPQKKGVVEAGVKYVKGNFLPTRQFRDLADLNAKENLRRSSSRRTDW